MEAVGTRWQAYLALGYCLIFLPGALLVVGVMVQANALVAVAFFVVLPLARVIFGDVPSAQPVWSEGWTRFLHHLPLAYPPLFAAMTLWLAWSLSRQPLLGRAEALLFGVSWWLVNSLATCVSHELLHRRERVGRALGRWLAAMAGYPILGQEHLSHHAHPGDTDGAEYPRADESAWSFAWRRVPAAWRHAREWDFGESARKEGRWQIDGLGACIAVTLAVWALFTVAAGTVGFMLYLAQIAGVHFSVQVITYLQHWALGDDAFDDVAAEQYAWEDTCQLQAWLILGLCLHHAHHLRPSLAYYRISPSKTSPRVPVAYAWLMPVALIPALWRRAMRPALEYWKRSPERPISPGRRLYCFGLYTGR